MWEFESYYAKALDYNARAEPARPGDLDFGLWLLLGFEMLTRAVLASKSPLLLAEGDASIASAFGVEGIKGTRSVGEAVVLTRLNLVIPEFTAQMVEDAKYLIALRNSELHSGATAIGNAPLNTWLPKLVRLTRVLADELGISVDVLIGAELTAMGENLIDEEDKKLILVVRTRINERRKFWESLKDEERLSRRSLGSAKSPWTIPCPSCSNTVRLKADSIRTSAARLVDGERISDVHWIVTGLECESCGLKLESTAEVKIAGLDQEFSEPTAISEFDFEDFDPDYFGDD